MDYVNHIWVILPAAPGADADAAVSRLLAPYDHAAVTATWTAPCGCDALAALDAADRALADEIHDLADDMLRCAPAARRAMSHAVNERVQAALAFHAATHPQPPAPDCPECGGGGQATLQGNPRGRWSDWQFDEEGEASPVDEDGSRLDGGAYFTARQAAVSRHLDEVIDDMVFGVVLPDGTWHDRRDHSDAAWRRLIRQLLALHPTARVAAVATT